MTKRLDEDRLALLERTVQLARQTNLGTLYDEVNIEVVEALLAEVRESRARAVPVTEDDLTALETLLASAKQGDIWAWLERAREDVPKLTAEVRRRREVEQNRAAFRAALEALVHPHTGHLMHPEGECTGECAEVRRVLGLLPTGPDTTTVSLKSELDDAHAEVERVDRLYDAVAEELDKAGVAEREDGTQQAGRVRDLAQARAGLRGAVGDVLEAHAAVTEGLDDEAVERFMAAMGKLRAAYETPPAGTGTTV